MFNKGKYVRGVIKGGYGGVRGAVVISEAVEHVSVESCFEVIESAGFFHINQDRTISVYGESISLETKSRPEEDAMYIYMALGLWEQ